MGIGELRSPDRWTEENAELKMIEFMAEQAQAEDHKATYARVHKHIHSKKGISVQALVMFGLAKAYDDIACASEDPSLFRRGKH